MNARFPPTIPEGYNIFETDLEVAGVHVTQAEVVAFANESAQSVELQAEPANSHDWNAIKSSAFPKAAGDSNGERLAIFHGRHRHVLLQADSLYVHV